MDDLLARSIRRAIVHAEAALAARDGDSRSHVRTLALLWAAHDELDAKK